MEKEDTRLGRIEVNGTEDVRKPKKDDQITYFLKLPQASAPEERWARWFKLIDK